MKRALTLIFASLLIVVGVWQFIDGMSGILGGDDRKQTEISEMSTEEKAEYLKEKCVSLTYEEAARNPDDHKNELVVFTGEVAQVENSSKKPVLLVKVTRAGGEYYSSYTDSVYVKYEFADELKLLEGDIVSLYGEFLGEKDYTSVLGQNITVPYMVAYYAEIVEDSSDEVINESIDDSEQSADNEDNAEQNKEDPVLSSATMGEKNALGSAKSYLRYSAFSYEGLIGQLEYEGYSHEEAVFAVEHCGADWNEQALKSAKDYLEYSAFSYTGLIKQLEYEKFTAEQATYGADNCGADWNEQAVKSAKEYLEYSSFSRQGLINQLEFEGFTYDQAVYGVTQNGY